MSHLIDHAEHEMRRAGLYDADADYDGMTCETCSGSGVLHQPDQPPAAVEPNDT